jgi:hypothetical protein
MASAVAGALSMAIGKAAGNGSVSGLTQTHAYAFTSALAARIWFMVKPWSLLVLLANLYLYWVHSTRYSRVNAIKKKYGYTNDPNSFKDMTIEIAQEVEKNLAEWDMPWLFELGWLFNFLAVSGSPFPSPSLVLFVSASVHNAGCYLSTVSSSCHYAHLSLVLHFVSYVRDCTMTHSCCLARVFSNIANSTCWPSCISLSPPSLLETALMQGPFTLPLLCGAACPKLIIPFPDGVSPGLICDNYQIRSLHQRRPVSRHHIHAVGSLSSVTLIVILKDNCPTTTRRHNHPNV